MSGVAIYMEGGGDGRDTKVALRQGMDVFLSSLKEAVRAKAWRWKLVCCGGRNAAFDGFSNAVQNQDEAIIALLVDAETYVKGSPRNHLNNRDGWNLNFTTDDMVHLMVQTMEAWIVADPDVLAAYYGQHFSKNALPKTQNLETVAKAAIATALENATRHTQKGAYHKIRHASDLLKQIDRNNVAQRCPNCARMFTALSNAIQNA